METEILIQNLDIGMLIFVDKKNRFLVVNDIVELETYPPKYRVKFKESEESEIYSHNTKVKIFEE